MEELAGKLWDRLVRRLADPRHPHAAVTLTEIAHTAGIVFRALGGEPGLEVKMASATAHGAARSLAARLAGTGDRAELAWRDGHALYLPGEIALFPRRELNRDLYLWLAALAAAFREGEWFQANQQAAQRVLARYPGWVERYPRLVEATIALRPDPVHMKPDQARQEAAIRAALRNPGSVACLPAAARPWHPVPLWLHPAPPRGGSDAPGRGDAPDQAGARYHRLREDRRHRLAERTDAPGNRHGLMLLFRAESLLSWAEYVRVNRPTEEDDGDDPAAAADDLDRLTLARDGTTTAARVRFDLDLPAPAQDDTPLGPGILLPEWDYTRQRLLPDHCRLQPMLAKAAPPCRLPPQLDATARRIRRQFQALKPDRIWLARQHQGSEPDLDAVVEHWVDRRAHRHRPERGLYRDLRNGRRQLACLLLADLSLSTDAHVSNEARVIDVIRDTLFLFAEALSASRDRFGLYGFSSLRREQVRFHLLKDFSEPYDDRARGRIAAIKPGYYTRMGAAIRHASRILAEQPAERRLLLIITDGKPNDLDRYEGRYGIEDTRDAVRQARRLGLQPFCVTVDEAGPAYLSHIFGLGRYLVIRRPTELPRHLPLLYARLTT